MVVKGLLLFSMDKWMDVINDIFSGKCFLMVMKLGSFSLKKMSE